MNMIRLLVALLPLTSACVSNSSQLGTRDSEAAAAYNLQLGIDYFRQGNLPEAKEKLDRSLKQNPKNAQTNMAVGMLYERLKDLRKAEQYYSRAVELDVDNGEVLNGYAVFLCRKGDHAKGEQLAIKAANNPLYKTPEAAWLNAGICALDGGKAEPAEAHFRKALALNARFAAALMQMTTLEFTANNLLPARGFLERFLQTSKDSAEALWLGVRIEQGLGNASGAADYARRLKAQFPTSVETKALLNAENKK
jgi:type IV pilus assembly protein PilF